MNTQDYFEGLKEVATKENLQFYNDGRIWALIDDGDLTLSEAVYISHTRDLESYKELLYSQKLLLQKPIKRTLYGVRDDGTTK